MPEQAPSFIPQPFMDAIQNAYAFFESLNISVSTLIMICVVLALVFLFAVREAASWFFKVDALKRDLKRLRKTTESLEEQISSLKALIIQTKQISINTPDLPEPIAAAETKTEPVSQPAPPPQFPIVHR